MLKKTSIIVLLILIAAITIVATKVNKKFRINNHIKEALKNLENNLEEYKALSPEIPFPLIENSNLNKENLSKTIIVSHFSLDNNFIHNVMENHKEYAKTHGYDYWFRNGIIDSTLIDLSQKKHKSRYMLCWQKLAAVKQAMEVKKGDKPKYEWIMWIDGDAIFTNFSKTLERLRTDINVTDKDYFIIAKDMYCKAGHIAQSPGSCVNSGVLLIKNDINGKKLIDTITKNFPYYKNYTFPEQSAINDYVFGLLKKSLTKLEYENIKPFYRCPSYTAPGVRVVDSNTMNSGFNKKDYKGGKSINLWKAGDFILHFAGIPKKLREQQINSFLTCIKDYPEDLSKCELNNLNVMFRNLEKNYPQSFFIIIKNFD